MRHLLAGIRRVAHGGVELSQMPAKRMPVPLASPSDPFVATSPVRGGLSDPAAP